MKESLSSKLYNFIQEKGVWINGGELERLAGEWGFKASNAGKRLREMSSNKHKDNDYKEPILHKESRPKVNSKGETIWYKAIQKSDFRSFFDSPLKEQEKVIKQVVAAANNEQKQLYGRHLSNQLTIF